MPTIDEYKKIADLLYPNIKKTVKDYLDMFPARNLPENAQVTRVAPSPTGFFHIGTFYQVLINRFLAKDGVFYLRLEDTDTKREVLGTADIIYPIITNFGVKIDEGFIAIGKETGRFGPYRQSERKEIYQAFAKDLIARGLAYPCFCEGTDESARKEQERLGVATGYYGRWAKCRDLSYEQVKANIEAGKPFTVRIKSNGDGTKRFVAKDLIKGEVSFPVNFVDYVLVKSDGLALYHLAHLVDDTLMHTTSVVRGEEWFPSIPLHYQLFEYFGFNKPNYLHTPLIMTIDQETGNQRKISKRKDPWANSQWFFEKGYPTNAVVEYLLNIINSKFEPWREQNPNADLHEFEFSIGNFSKSGAMFDMMKLNNIAKNMMSRLTGEEVYEKTLAWANTYNPNFAKMLNEYRDYAIKVFSIDKNPDRPRKDITTFSEVEEFYSYMFDNKFNIEFDAKISNEKTKEVLRAYLEALDFNADKDSWFAGMKDCAEKCGFAKDNKMYKAEPEKFAGNVADFSTIIRLAITGRRQTPDLYAIIQTLGENETKRRLQNAIEKV